jgi:phage gp29-like protein
MGGRDPSVPQSKIGNRKSKIEHGELRMGMKARIVNALRGKGGTAARPRPGQVVGAEPLERWREYPADGLTPAELARILREADEGAADRALALFEQMEEKDAHLQSVANTRRLALTGLKWQVVSAAEMQEGVDRAGADEAADYCRAALARIERFDEVLQHLSLAIGRNIAIAENVWEARGRELGLVEIVPVGFDRIAFDEAGLPRVLTKESPYDGIELAADKFVVHSPHAVSGHPMRGGLMRSTALAYLAKHFSMKDWMIYAELFGMPVRIARYEPGATAEEKRELLNMLQSLGADAAGIFSKAIEVQLLEAGRGTAPPPYEGMCDFFNRELSKAWLGQTLTVEAAASQSQQGAAGPTVHNEVRLDIRQDDIVKEGRTVRRDILGPMTRLRFGPDTPVPFFRRQLELPRDLKQLADVLNVAVNDLGMRVSTDWAHRALGVPADGGGAVLGGRRGEGRGRPPRRVNSDGATRRAGSGCTVLRGLGDGRIMR